MKNFFYSALLLCALISCKNPEEQEGTTTTKETSPSYGEEISAEGTLDAETIADKYKKLEPGDTIRTSFTSTVNSVCKMKGCWMNLEIPGEEDVSVKFKDYGFFVPKDIEGKEVVVEGKAFLKEVSVKDQKHFAKDAGKSEEEIAVITKPRQELAFLTNGVLLKQ